jgi:hypothetical protein
MVATTNFIQGDGTRQSTKSVSVVWININPDSRIFLFDSVSITKHRNVSLQIDVDGLDE